MVIVDNLLKARAAEGKPIKVAILGSGFMAQGLTNQIVNSVAAMEVVASIAETTEGNSCSDLRRLAKPC
jgi:predicted homoserine dehydrogenase-like protein